MRNVFILNRRSEDPVFLRIEIDLISALQSVESYSKDRTPLHAEAVSSEQHRFFVFLRTVDKKKESSIQFSLEFRSDLDLY